MAIIPSLMVLDVHFTMMVHPEFTHNDVMDGRGDFTPGVVITRLMEY